MKLITVVTACYNEEDNIALVYQKVRDIFASLPNYRYEHLFIDNASEDRTASILKKIAASNKNVKVIINTRNFGHIRSPSHALREAKGDAVISIVADLQDPPEMILQFIKKWEEGYKVVVGVKPSAAENPFKASLRRLCYRGFSKLSSVKQIRNFTGFGLYDKAFMDAYRELNDAYPYFRGIVADIGYEVAEIPYHQPKRQRGITKNNFFTLYDMAILALTNYSKTPIRLMTLIGFILGTLSFITACIFLILKLFLWHSFATGIAPILIGIFFFSSVQLFFMGIIGEYIAAIQTQALNRPLVFEKERINFDDDHS